MKNRWNYRCAGLSIASQIELPEWAPFACVAPDATIQFALKAPAPLPDDTHFRVAGHNCDFTVPDVASYRVQAGWRVEITPAPDAGEREIRLFLLGSAWGILNYQRGNFALHAGIVRARDADGDPGCLAFCGASGAGKSSTVAHLLGAGFELWSDDLTICQLDEVPLVWPSTRRLKLWRASLDALGRACDDLERDQLRQEKFHWTLESPRSLAHQLPLPLRAIYLLEWGEAEAIRLRGLEALRGFVEAATYRGTVLSDMGAAAPYWEQCARIVGSVPVWRLKRPRDWAALPAALRPVTQYWTP